MLSGLILKGSSSFAIPRCVIGFPALPHSDQARSTIAPSAVAKSSLEIRSARLSSKMARMSESKVIAAVSPASLAPSASAARRARSRHSSPAASAIAEKMTPVVGPPSSHTRRHCRVSLAQHARIIRSPAGRHSRERYHVVQTIGPDRFDGLAQCHAAQLDGMARLASVFGSFPISAMALGAQVLNWRG